MGTSQCDWFFQVSSLDLCMFLGAGNSNIFGIFTPKIGEDEPILTSIFQMGWFNHQLDNSAGHFENLLLKHLQTENGMVS